MYKDLPKLKDEKTGQSSAPTSFEVPPTIPPEAPLVKVPPEVTLTPPEAPPDKVPGDHTAGAGVALFFFSLMYLLLVMMESVPFNIIHTIVLFFICSLSFMLCKLLRITRLSDRTL